MAECASEHCFQRAAFFDSASCLGVCRLFRAAAVHCFMQQSGPDALGVLIEQCWHADADVCISPHGMQTPSERTYLTWSLAPSHAPAAYAQIRSEPSAVSKACSDYLKTQVVVSTRESGGRDVQLSTSLATSTVSSCSLRLESKAAFSLWFARPSETHS